MTTMRIVLASGSAHRRKLLADAGVDFTVRPSTLDERALEAPLLRSGASPEDVALVLAEAKAVDVSTGVADALVIGADQTLSLEGRLFHKPADMEAARRALLQLAGRTHRLDSAVVLARNGAAVWRHVSVASLAMRPLTPPAIGRYLAKAGEAALGSVGCYQIEGIGLQLMEQVEGDFWTIVGLPMLPLLAELRRQGAVED